MRPVQDTVNKIRAEGGEAMGVTVNVTDEASVQKMMMTSWTPMAESTCW